MLEKLETEAQSSVSIVTLEDAVTQVGKLRFQAAQDFSHAKAIVADKMLTLGKLNRSTDDLDALDDQKSFDSG